MEQTSNCLRALQKDINNLLSSSPGFSGVDDGFSSSSIQILPKQSDLFKGILLNLVSFTGEWIDRVDDSAEEIAKMYEKDFGNAVAEELLRLVKRGLQLLRQSAEGVYSTYFIFLSGSGELTQIFDDVEKCCKMIFDLLDAVPIVRTEASELDCSVLNKLIIFKEAQIKKKLAYEEDKDALIGVLKRDYLTDPAESSFLKMLEKGSHPIDHSIQTSDLKKQKILGTDSFGTIHEGILYGKLPVAIKEFRYRVDFEYELKALTKITASNPLHIVQIFGQSENTLVMELMEMDLKKFIEEQSPSFLLEDWIEVMLQIAKGIRSLHMGGVIHRDIKPSNILVKQRKDGTWIFKLANFGTCKADFHTGINTAHTGTWNYMPPEMITNKAKDTATYSKKLDVYSFGVVCTEILTGSPPDIKLLRAGKMPSLPEAIPENLNTLICDCLQLIDQQRPSFEGICDRLWQLKHINAYQFILKSLDGLSLEVTLSPSLERINHYDKIVQDKHKNLDKIIRLSRLNNKAKKKGISSPVVKLI